MTATLPTTECPTWCTREDHSGDNPYHASTGTALVGAGAVQSTPHMVSVVTSFDPSTDGEPLIELTDGHAPILLSAAGAHRLAAMLAAAAEEVGS